VTASASRGQPLSLRLALVLSVAVVAVLLVAGLAVNRLVSGPLENELSAAQRDRLTAVAAGIGQVDLTRPGGRLAVELVLRRTAAAAHGTASLLDPRGQPILTAGQLPAGVATERFTQPVPGSDSVVAVDVPRPERSFLGLFNLTLIVAGILAVVVLVVAALLLSDRLTRPLRGVAAAAQRLGAGDLSARASGGPDRESAELAGAFNTMAERLQRSEELRRRAASDMAHDLATPATVLESQLQAMLDGVVPTDQANLEAARASASALGSVIVQLGDLASAEAAPLQARPERMDVASLLAEAGQALEGLFRERGVQLQVEAVMPGLAALADPAQLARALRNVLTNAAQHTPGGKAVRVMAAAADHRVEIRVVDEGSGIPEADLPHIFERFYRSDPSRAGQAGAGAGIGLTIARELLAGNGGSIAVERSGRNGTVILVTVPQA
jgi:two-component system, OmpR family, sensor histidine kinase BaeS